MKKKTAAILLGMTMIGTMFVGSTVLAEEATGGTLKLVSQLEPSGWLSTDLASTDDNTYAAFVTEPLGLFDESGIMQPFLAEEFIEDGEKLTFTIKVKEGISFSDGSHLNAEIIAWNIQYFQDKKQNLGDIASIEAIDDMTVVITFNSWNNSFRTDVGNIHIMSKQSFDEMGEEAFAKKPVGTGPFLFESWSAGEEFTLVKNDAYWGEGPYIDGVEVKFITDEQSRLSAFQAGELDVVMAESIQFISQLDASGFQCISENPTVGAMLKGLAFNTVDEGPLQDVRVREAVCRAMNKEAIVQAFSGGRYTVTDQYCAPGFWSYNEELETFGYDTDKAVELLEEAGYADGCPVTLTYNIADASQATIYQGLLEEAGFIVTMNSMEWSAYDAAVVGGGGWEGIALWTSGADARISTFDNQFGENSWFFASSIAPIDEIIETINEGKSVTTQEEMDEVADRLQKLVCVDYCLVCPVFTFSGSYYAQDYVRDYNLATIAMTQSTPNLIKLEK